MERRTDMGKKIVVDPNTGGAKESRLAKPALIPAEQLLALARVYGMGAEKYSPHNWRKGYDWSLSADAGMRHFLSWLAGEDLDPESGENHLLHVAWHCLTLAEFARIYPEGDDRENGRVIDSKYSELERAFRDAPGPGLGPTSGPES